MEDKNTLKEQYEEEYADLYNCSLEHHDEAYLDTIV